MKLIVLSLASNSGRSPCGSAYFHSLTQFFVNVLTSSCRMWTSRLSFISLPPPTSPTTVLRECTNNYFDNPKLTKD